MDVSGCPIESKWFDIYMEPASRSEIAVLHFRNQNSQKLIKAFFMDLAMEALASTSTENTPLNDFLRSENIDILVQYELDSVDRGVV